MITDQQIAKDEQLCEAATAGPWTDDAHGYGRAILGAYHGGRNPSCTHLATVLGNHTSVEITYANTAFIKRARTAMPEYLAEIKRLREIVSRLPVTADGAPIVPGMRLRKSTGFGGVVCAKAVKP